MQISTGRADRASLFIGSLCFPENFCFTANHRVRPRSDAKQMLYTSSCFISVKHSDVTIELDGVGSRKAARDLFSRDKIFGRGINFHAVAGAQEQRLIATTAS